MTDATIFSVAHKSLFKDVPVHLDASTVTFDGEVYHSLPTKMVVLRLLQARDIVALLRLGEIALKESQAVRAELMVCDVRALGPAAADLMVTALLLHLLRAGASSGRRVALLLANRVVSPVTAEVLDAISKTGIVSTVEDSFEGLAQAYAVHSEEMRIWLGARPADFVGSYHGSTYSIASLQCTVLRTTGSATEIEYDIKFVARMLKNHVEMQRNTIIFDTSSSPPVNMKKYRFMFEHVLMPLLSAHAARTIIHVRSSGDRLVRHDAPPIPALLESFQVPLHQVHSMGEALKLLRVLKGQLA